MTADEIGRLALAAYAGAIAALALVHFILRALRRVVASASAGDPFIEANATELVRVAWLLLGVEVIETLIKPWFTCSRPTPCARRSTIRSMSR